MGKIVAILAVVALLGIATPTSADETVTVRYNGAPGAYTFATGGVGVVVCPYTCNLDEDPFTGEDLDLLDPLGPIGGSRVAAPSGSMYSNALVKLEDEGFWGNSAATSACFYNPDGDNTCDGDDNSSSVGCGAVSLTQSPFASNEITVWAWGVAVLEDLTVCGATYGTISVSFF